MWQHGARAGLHSKKPQAKRMAAVQRFKAKAARVLVATDVASRGLDIPSVRAIVR
jgi:ATP-dependent RNA helicase DDX49/DBP8